MYQVLMSARRVWVSGAAVCPAGLCIRCCSLPGGSVHQVLLSVRRVCVSGAAVCPAGPSVYQVLLSDRRVNVSGAAVCPVGLCIRCCCLPGGSVYQVLLSARRVCVSGAAVCPAGLCIRCCLSGRPEERKGRRCGRATDAAGWPDVRPRPAGRRAVYVRDQSMPVGPASRSCCCCCCCCTAGRAASPLTSRRRVSRPQTTGTCAEITRSGVV